jgi:cold-inducible RNA-binding protein
MVTKLYVGNLPDDVSTNALRARFAEVAPVADVELAVDRSSGRMRGYAFVRMESPEGARRAIDQLNGAMFEERRLRVNEAGEEREEGRSGSRSGGKSKKDEVRVTMQFRERHGMTYEVDCAGTALCIRMLPTDQSEKSWRIEAILKQAVDENSHPVIAATAATRALAIEEISRMWNVERPLRGLPAIGWDAVTHALIAVRAM